jgi:hypothetical protein
MSGIPTYNRNIGSGILSSSYEESYMLTKIPCHKKEGKRVKILKCPEEGSNVSFEDIINEFIIESTNKYELIDIKYTDKSCLIIYKLL